MKTTYLRNSDLVLGMFVVAIAAMLLIPLPTFLLDFLLVLNISFSLLLLLVGLYMPNALALLAFPSLLLLTTLFRLGLNVASTRLILSQADAGDVIQAFGTFLIRGEIVVGVIIFTIITIVNFIVIARGSSRVSEVAARFALDALPGKQMTIDSDLRAGLITPAQAEERREQLRKESQLYGSMDGAMKFVQGDAIAGFFIILTNILGGLYLGLTNGLAFIEAVQTYTTLTVGDGLVSQIPALLISICAGIVVTRVSAEKDSTLGSDVSRQLFRRPATLFLAGALLLFLGALPGLPILPFALVATCFFFGAWLAAKQYSPKTTKRDIGTLPSQSLALPNYQQPDRKMLSVESDHIVIHLDATVFYPLYERSKDNVHSYWTELQTHLWEKSGISLPQAVMVSDESMMPGMWSFYLRQKHCTAGQVPLDAMLVEMNPNHADIFGLPVLQEEVHPFSNALIFWTQDRKRAQAFLDQAEIPHLNFYHYIGLKVAEFVFDHPHEFLRLSDVHTRLKELEANHPGLLEDSLNTEFFTTARITQIFQRYVKEGGSIKDITEIVEGLAGYASSYGANLIRENEFDKDDIVSYLRLDQKRRFQNTYATNGQTLRACTLSEGVQQLFEIASVDSVSGTPILDGETRRKLIDGLETAFENVQQRGIMPLVIIASHEVRALLIKFIEGIQHRYVVLTPAEVGPTLEVEAVTVWRL